MSLLILHSILATSTCSTIQETFPIWHVNASLFEYVTRAHAAIQLDSGLVVVTRCRRRRLIYKG